MAFKIEDVPTDVMTVWAIKIACRLGKTGAGIDVLNKCQDVINKHPEWFPADPKKELPDIHSIQPLIR